MADFDDIVTGFATYRIARLVVDDEIFDILRARFQTWLLGRNDFVLKLVSCGYCVSVWIAAALTFGRRRGFRSWMAASGVAAAAWSLDRIAVAKSA